MVKGRAESGNETKHYEAWIKRWWQPRWFAAEFLRATRTLPRLVACSRHASRPIFMFLDPRFLPTESLQLFSFCDDYTFGVLQSNLHWAWAVGIGSKIKEDTRYTTDVWRTFPWPQDPSDAHIEAVASAAREVRRVRAELMETNQWSLRQLHQAAEVEGLHPLKDAQAALDAAVADAYGMPPDQGPTEFLLELNQLVAEDEQQGRKVRGPGLPDHLGPKDPRWFSTDCIEPPPVGS